MFNSSSFFILLGVLVLGAALLSTIAIMAFNAWNREDRNAAYRRSIAAAFMEEYEGDEYNSTDGKISLFDRWFVTWGRLMQEVSRDRYNPDEHRAGVDVIVGFIAIVALVTIFAGNFLAGFAFAIIALVALFFVLKSKASKQEEKLLQQLTGFLHGLKANISGAKSPEVSLMNVIKTTSNPLRAELEPAEKMIRANVSFGEAMHALRETTKSADLQFLASCIILGSKTGTSLEGQLDIIIDSVDSSKRRTEEINRGEKNASLGIKVASAVLPGSFIALYLMDQRTRDFWFIHPFSWPALLAAVLLFGVGIFLARRYVSKVRELN